MLWDIAAVGHQRIRVRADNEKAARETARFWLGLEKLPKHTEVRPIPEH